jgi:Domain of unknown function (DUF4296)
MKVVLLILITILLVGCSNHAIIPPDVIPKSKMEMVIWQMMQADEFFTNYVMKDSAKNTTAERTKLYQQVFALNKITKEDFRKSYEFYIRRPEISRPMFDSLSAKASRRRGEVYSKPYLPKDSLRTDSLRSDSSFHRRLLKLRRDTLK